jgi:transposase
MMLQIGHNEAAPQKQSFGNHPGGREKMVASLKERAKAAGGADIVFAYEAGPHGYGLYDDLTEAGIRCHVLAPSRLPQSAKGWKNKTDEKDALRILEVVRGHLLAGNRLPEVWVPDAETRDDRELVRARLDAGDKARRIQHQIRMLLKRTRVTEPEETRKRWTLAYRAWLGGLVSGPSALGKGARVVLGSLLRQLGFLEEEVEQLDGEVARLAVSERYRAVAQALDEETGVGVFTAMVYLTEMGDLRRFSSRRKVGAYTGLVPCSDETGERTDRKGHITRQGSARIRRALCQATWSRVQNDSTEKAAYGRIVKKNPKKKKIAVVACMRRLAVTLWRRGIAAQGAMPPSRPPEGGKRQFALPAQPRKYERRPTAVAERRCAV